MVATANLFKGPAWGDANFAPFVTVADLYTKYKTYRANWEQIKRDIRNKLLDPVTWAGGGNSTAMAQLRGSLDNTRNAIGAQLDDVVTRVTEPALSLDLGEFAVPGLEAPGPFSFDAFSSQAQAAAGNAVEEIRASVGDNLGDLDLFGSSEETGDEAEFVPLPTPDITLPDITFLLSFWDTLTSSNKFLFALADFLRISFSFVKASKEAALVLQGTPKLKKYDFLAKSTVGTAGATRKITARQTAHIDPRRTRFAPSPTPRVGI